MEAYNDLIAVIVDTICEFAEKLTVLAPTLESQCKTLRGVAFNLQYAKELIFRIIVIVITDRFRAHVDLLQGKNPGLWEKVDLFGFDMKGLWMRADITEDTKECIWSYLQLFVDTCIRAADMKDLAPNVLAYDATVHSLLSHASLLHGPTVLTYVQSQLGGLSLA